MRESETRTFEDVFLTAADRELVKRIGEGGDRRLQIGKPTALLMYPASRGEQQVVELQIWRDHASVGASIFSLGIPIPSALDELEAGWTGPIQAVLREFVDRSLGAAASVL